MKSTKKAKFKAQGENGDNLDPLSFKDKLMESKMAIEEGLVGCEDDIIF